MAIQSLNEPGKDSDQTVDAQADLNLRWAHMSECTISGVAAYLSLGILICSIFLRERYTLQDQLSRPLSNTGRQLLSVQEDAEDGWDHTNYIHKLHSLILEYGGGAGVKGNRTELPFLNMCPTYFNKTESMR